MKRPPPEHRHMTHFTECYAHRCYPTEQSSNMTRKTRRAERADRKRHLSGDFLHEDVAQERALAELLGTEFTERHARAVKKSFRPARELSFANVEVVLYPRSSELSSTRRKPPVGGSFIREKARHRDAPIEALIRELISKKLSYRQIAAELTRRNVPKVHSWAAGKQWSVTGVGALVRKLGMRSQPDRDLEGCRRGGRTRGDQLTAMKRGDLRDHMRKVGAGMSPARGRNTGAPARGRNTGASSIASSQEPERVRASAQSQDVAEPGSCLP